MPIYEYECSGCGDEHEVIQKIGAGALRKCPSCGAPAEFAKGDDQLDDAVDAIVAAVDDDAVRALSVDTIQPVLDVLAAAEIDSDAELFAALARVFPDWDPEELNSELGRLAFVASLWSQYEHGSDD